MEKRSPWRQLAFGVVLVALALFMAVWRYSLILPLRWVTDEGAYLMGGYWVSRGYELFSQVSVLGYPGFIEWLGLVFRLFEPTMQTGRISILLFAAVYVMIVGFAARRLSSPIGGIAAAGVVLLDREVVDLAGWTFAEIPALTLVAVSVWFALRYLDNGHRRCLLGAALACGLGLLMKPVAFLLPVWIAAMVPVRNFWVVNEGNCPRSRQFLLDGALAFAAFVVPFLLCLLVYDVGAFLGAAFKSRIELRELAGWTPSMSWAQIRDYLDNYQGASVLAASSLLYMSRSKVVLQRLAIWLLFVVMFAGLMWFSPLYRWHAVILSLPIAILAGVGLDGLFRALRTGERRVVTFVGVILFLLGLLLQTMEMPRFIAWQTNPAKYRQGGQEEAALDLLQRITYPAEIIISDDQEMAFVVHRYVPPQLSDVSYAQVRSGNITDAVAISAAQAYDVQTIVLWRNRLDWLRDFVRWVEGNFVGVVDLGGQRRILHGRRYEDVSEVSGIRPVAGVVLGDAFALRGYRLDFDELGPGRTLGLVLYWECLRVVDRDYQVFVHLVDSTGQPRSQADGPPVNGMYPTSQWKAGEILADVHPLPLDPALPPGEYVLLAGMYDLRSLARLPVQDTSDHVARDAVRLTSVDLAIAE